MAHTLGNPFDLAAVTAFCRQHDLWLVEDNCDALGSTYPCPVTAAAQRLTGHVRRPVHAIVLSAAPPHAGRGRRGEHRPATCGSSCSSRASAIGAAIAGAPAARTTPAANVSAGSWANCREGYDHKYIYSHLGYNLKPLDIQAAIGRQQLRKLPAFSAARRANWQFLRGGAGRAGGVFRVPASHPRDGLDAGERRGFTWDEIGRGGRPELVRLHADGASGRAVHPDRVGPAPGREERSATACFLAATWYVNPPSCSFAASDPGRSAWSGDLAGADRIMREALFVGVYPGLSREALEFLAAAIIDFCRAASVGIIVLILNGGRSPRDERVCGRRHFLKL